MMARENRHSMPLRGFVWCYAHYRVHDLAVDEVSVDTCLLVGRKQGQPYADREDADRMPLRVPLFGDHDPSRLYWLAS